MLTATCLEKILRRSIFILYALLLFHLAYLLAKLPRMSCCCCHLPGQRGSYVRKSKKWICHAFITNITSEHCMQSSRTAPTVRLVEPRLNKPPRRPSPSLPGNNHSTGCPVHSKMCLLATSTATFTAGAAYRAGYRTSRNPLTIPLGTEIKQPRLSPGPIVTPDRGHSTGSPVNFQKRRNWACQPHPPRTSQVPAGCQASWNSLTIPSEPRSNSPACRPGPLLHHIDVTRQGVR